MGNLLDRSRIKHYAVRQFRNESEKDMTIQNLFVVSLKDISQIQIECKCGACFTYDPDKEIRLPMHCHQCHADWKDDFANTRDQQLVEGFMRLIRETRQQQVANARMRIKLVFSDDETNGSSSPNVP